MAIGIWTPVAGSTVRKVFDVVRTSFGEQKFNFAPVAGTHMMILARGHSCDGDYVYYSATEPADVAAALLGTPIPYNVAFVIPRTAACWIYCPHETMEVMVTVGALT